MSAAFGTILVVEDHRATRESMAHILRHEGAVVCEAADGAAARRLLREEAWGLSCST